MEEPSAVRLRGMKKKKLEWKVENGTQRVARSVDKMASALESPARDMRKAASLGLQLETLKNTIMADTGKRRILDALRSDAATFLATMMRQHSSSLATAPSFVVMGPNSSSFQQFSEAERTGDDVTETGAAFFK